MPADTAFPQAIERHLIQIYPGVRSIVVWILSEHPLFPPFLECRRVTIRVPPNRISSAILRQTETATMDIKNLSRLMRTSGANSNSLSTFISGFPFGLHKLRIPQLIIFYAYNLTLLILFCRMPHPPIVTWNVECFLGEVVLRTSWPLVLNIFVNWRIRVKDKRYHSWIILPSLLVFQFSALHRCSLEAISA